MRRATLLGGVFLVALPSVALADIEQDNQLMFGLMGAYVPQQNNLPNDVACVGQYMSFAHSFDFLYLGLRLAILYGWLPSGATGQQWLLEPDVFIGVGVKPIKRLALKLEVGTGPVVNGGEGFPTATVNHTYVRALAQLTVVKSVVIEAFGGPTFLIGSSVVGGAAEFGLGGGWKF